MSYVHLRCGKAAGEGLAEDGKGCLIRATAPSLPGHLEETKTQVERLEQAFDRLETGTRGKRCEAMQGLVEEASQMMEEIKIPQILDAALIAGAQKVEHYEIAAYGSVRALAEACGHQQVAQLLDETLEEEKAADQKLNQIALSEVNPSALAAAA